MQVCIDVQAALRYVGIHVASLSPPPDGTQPNTILDSRRHAMDMLDLKKLGLDIEYPYLQQY
ncbi:MAG: hypothetical protein ACTHJZ_14800, partial [Trinickia sp.]|uniref:hypothetical protein n=1 Tax=Trinickia sp. TaxID=2571163 RepID=UPI003F7EC825